MNKNILIESVVRIGGSVQWEDSCTQIETYEQKTLDRCELSL